MSGKMVRKGDLPEKICASCGRPFVWRRKWARDWAAVRYCSDRCRSDKTKVPPSRGSNGCP
jgi:hypothetical protein